MPPQILWRNREAVMTDQLLRAKGSGVDRLSNPIAYDFRRRYGRSYYREEEEEDEDEGQHLWHSRNLSPFCTPSRRVQAGLCVLLDSPHLW